MKGGTTCFLAQFTLASDPGELTTRRGECKAMFLGEVDVNVKPCRGRPCRRLGFEHNARWVDHGRACHDTVTAVHAGH